VKEWYKLHFPSITAPESGLHELKLKLKFACQDLQYSVINRGLHWRLWTKPWRY